MEQADSDTKNTNTFSATCLNVYYVRQVIKESKNIWAENDLSVSLYWRRHKIPLI